MGFVLCELCDLGVPRPLSGRPRHAKTRNFSWLRFLQNSFRDFVAVLISVFVQAAAGVAARLLMRTGHEPVSGRPGENRRRSRVQRADAPRLRNSCTALS